jgi:hypothetical protein
MTIEIYLILVYVQTSLSAVVSILALARYRSRSLNVRLIGFIFLASCIANAAAYLFIMSPITRPFINATYPVYLIITMPLFTQIYYNLLHRRHPWRLKTVTWVFITFALINLFFIQKTAGNSYSYFFHSAIMIVYSLSYFHVLIKDVPSLRVHQLPMFWFNSAVLVFHAGVFFLFSFYDYLVHVLKNDLLIYWSFHNVLSILEQILILIGLYHDLTLLKSTPERPHSIYTNR